MITSPGRTGARVRRSGDSASDGLAVAEAAPACRRRSSGLLLFAQQLKIRADQKKLVRVEGAYARPDH
jgi:hypothetical protein